MRGMYHMTHLSHIKNMINLENIKKYGLLHRKYHVPLLHISVDSIKVNNQCLC